MQENQEQHPSLFPYNLERRIAPRIAIGIGVAV